MPPITDYKLDKKLRLLVYGKSKAGKTAGAATFPRPNFIDFDAGVSTVLSPWWRDTFGARSDIMYEQFPEKGSTTRGVYNSANAFDDACRYFDACMSPKATKWTSTSNGQTYEVSSEMFDTWVLDSGTSLSAAAARKAIIVLGQGSKALSQTHKTALSTGLVVLKQQDFGAERSLTEQFITMLLQTNKNVVVVCHEKEVYNDDGNLVGIVPLFTGQSTERVPLLFDEVYNLRSIKEGVTIVRKLTTQADGIRLVGTRGLNMPNGTAWNYDAIMKAIPAATN